MLGFGGCRVSGAVGFFKISFVPSHVFVLLPLSGVGTTADVCRRPPTGFYCGLKGFRTCVFETRIARGLDGVINRSEVMHARFVSMH